MNVLETAKHWLELGIATIQVPEKEKAAQMKWKKYQTELPSPKNIEQWFRQPANLAVVTGWNGLTVIDFDDNTVYQSWLRYGDENAWAAMVQKFTYQVQAAKGRHVYVRTPEANKSRALTKANGDRWGIDIKARGGYVLAPPSIHPSGVQYKVINPVEFLMIESKNRSAPHNLSPQSIAAFNYSFNGLAVNIHTSNKNVIGPTYLFIT